MVNGNAWAGIVLVFGAAMAIALHPKARTSAFAAWVVAAVLAALIYPKMYLEWTPLSYGALITILLQLAMFGMGATLTADDFVRVLKMPRGIFIGLLLQFSVMPFLGWGLSQVFRLPPDLTLGMILLGASPGGISSNVITYLAKGNVALSVTMTAMSTLVAPIMTPLMVYLYAGQSVGVDYVAMFVSILTTVVAPVLAGLVVNGLLVKMRLPAKLMERFLAVVSMVAICAICGMIAAKSQSLILQVGGLLLIAVLLHNVFGFLFGYWGSRWCGLNEQDSRTVAIEVGLQNGGMAASLATEVLKQPAAAIVPALFAPVMNVSGSIAAAYWSKHASEAPVAISAEGDSANAT
jgi:BASS family bile acid:Na+ symporter